MKISKRLICFMLIIAMLSGMGAAFAANAQSGDARAVIGANLTEDQVAQVYDIFGIERGSVTELTVTNAEERRYLEGLVDESIIGHNSISCVYVKVLDEGEGLTIGTQNLTWCTQEMFINALVTAGIYDAEIIVCAPFAVSGTAALTGIFKAYEDITGEEIDPLAKLAGTQELVITGELADEIGKVDAVEIVNQLKLILNETSGMSDEELAVQIRAIAKDMNIALTDSQVSQLITLCRGLEKLDSDQLQQKVEQLQNTVKKLGEAHEKLTVITDFIKGVVEKVSEFFQKIFSFFGFGKGE